MHGFELLGRDGDETRIAHAPKAGYSLTLAGRPRVEETSADRSIDLRLVDVPVEVTLELRDVSLFREAGTTVATLATEYAVARAATVPTVRPIGDLSRPRETAAGAQALYQVAGSASKRLEQLWVLLRPSSSGFYALYQTIRFEPAELNVIQWAHVRAAIINEHRWAREEPASFPPVWPSSAWVKRSAALDLNDEGWREAEAKARDLGELSEQEVQATVSGLFEVVQTDHPPKQPLGKLLASTYSQTVAMQSPKRVSDVLLRNFAACHSHLDLRGWAWQCAWAVGNRLQVRALK